MTIDRTFKDTAWYWAPLGKAGADGIPRFADAVLIAPPYGGRWDDNPSTLVTPEGEKICINAKFTTRVIMQSGGWLLKTGDYPADPTVTPPTQFPAAREINAVGTFKNFQRTVTFYQALLK